MFRRVSVLAGAVVVTVVAGSAPAPAAPLSAGDERAVLRAEEAVRRDCSAALRPAGTPGVATRAWTATAPGLLTAQLHGGHGGDWDLAVFRQPAAGALAGSTSFTSEEQASAWVKPGEQLVVQACRRVGGAASVPLTLRLFEMPPPSPSAERFSLESVSISGLRDVARLEALGLDVTHDVGPTSATVALYSDAERAQLVGAGFESRTLVHDMAAADRADRLEEARDPELAVPTALPSGRTGYRVYEDYTSEMKQLAEANPGLVRPLVLGTTFEGRPLEGLEIAADVARTDDGRPAYLNLGVHHAREWPSGEMPMEFAHDLVDGFAEGGRIRDLLHRVRVIAVPVVNVDGFLVSRTFGATPVDGNQNATLGLSLADAAAYKRKNCRPPAAQLATVPCVARPVGLGVDLNRNYGAYWGGGGASTEPTAQNYRGTAPFSESEAEAIHRLSARLHPTVVISNHTFTTGGTWLRQPGFRTFGNTVPDEASMKSLGDAMAAATGWASQLGWAIGDITGATEDWNYFAQGSLGYTPEGRGPNFHGDYNTVVVNEYVGTGARAGLGVREAFLRSVERAADPIDHGVLTGTAPPGATLKLTKSFRTPTCQTSCQAPTLFVDDVLETRLEVTGTDGYEWHVNPSGRPFVPNEVWTMTCQIPGQPEFTRTVAVRRGERVTVDWRGGACGNEPPAAAFAFAPEAPRAWDEITFTSSSTDPEDALASLAWDLDGDGEFEDGQGGVVTHTFTEPGTHRVALRATDAAGATDVAVREVDVAPAPPNALPVAEFGVSPASPRRHQAVALRSTSTDADGPLVAQEWDLDDDGEFDDATGGEVTHAFARSGRQRVWLRVTDRRGATDATSRWIVVRGPGEEDESQ